MKAAPSKKLAVFITSFVLVFVLINVYSAAKRAGVTTVLDSSAETEVVQYSRGEYLNGALASESDTVVTELPSGHDWGTHPDGDPGTLFIGWQAAQQQRKGLRELFVRNMDEEAQDYARHAEERRLAEVSDER